MGTVANDIETDVPRGIQEHIGAPRKRQTGTQTEAGAGRGIQTQAGTQKADTDCKAYTAEDKAT